jgi:hypothetical protein
MTPRMAPLAFVYDRCATRSQRELDMRLVGCHAHADLTGWVLAGRWLDLGDHALSTDRPQFAKLVEAMRKASASRDVVCLVHNWGRLATDDAERIALQKRIADAGGHVATTFNESDAGAHHVRAGRAHA